MKNQNPKQPQSSTEEKSIQDNVDQELEHLRLHLDTIDQQIVSLLSKRQAEVERVVQLKKAYNIPVYHPAREENLISQRRNQGSKAGLDPDYVEEIYRRILRQSRAEQTAQMAQKGVRAGASILIIGGLGVWDNIFSNGLRMPGTRCVSWTIRIGRMQIDFVRVSPWQLSVSPLS